MKPIRHFPLMAAFGAAVLLTSAMHPASAADMRKIVRDNQGHVVTNTFNNCVRTDWASQNDPCSANAPIAAPQHYSEVAVDKIALDQRTVYFDFDKYNLKSAERSRLDNLANNLKSDENVREASIVGYADRIGDSDYNDRLSQKRAAAVQKYLADRGVINTRVTETRWLGESAPVTNCPTNISRSAQIDCLSKDRRVEVEVDYRPERTARY